MGSMTFDHEEEKQLTAFTQRACLFFARRTVEF